MNDDTPARLKRVWNQNKIPVLLRRGKGNRPRFRLPDHDYLTWAWIRQDSPSHHEWNQKDRYWEIPEAWFNRLVEQCLDKYGKIYIIQPYRIQEKCAPACWNALGDVCQCSCMGERHGERAPAGRWRIVSDTFATSWNELEMACRMIERRAPLACEAVDE